MDHKEKLARIISWTHNPEPRSAVIDYLNDLTDEELNASVLTTQGVAGRLLWLEFGVRKGHIAPLRLDVQEVEGVLELEFSAQASSAIENVILGRGALS